MEYLDITIEDPRWLQSPFVDLTTRAIQATLSHASLPEDAIEISILACDDTQITTLNTAFRDKPKATNVLSWPNEERAAMCLGGQPLAPASGPDGLIALGDIAISYDTCAAEARAAGKPLEDHLTHLIIHATLHLLGYDHETEPDAALMETLEVKILGKLGLDDPYSMS